MLFRSPLQNIKSIYILIFNKMFTGGSSVNVGAPELLSDTLEQAGTGHCLKLVCEMEALVKASSYDLWLWELMSSAAPEDRAQMMFLSHWATLLLYWSRLGSGSSVTYMHRGKYVGVLSNRC